MTKASNSEINHAMRVVLTNALAHRILIPLAESQECAMVFLHRMRDLLHFIIDTKFRWDSQGGQDRAILGNGLTSLFW